MPRVIQHTTTGICRSQFCRLGLSMMEVQADRMPDADLSYRWRLPFVLGWLEEVGPCQKDWPQPWGSIPVIQSQSAGKQAPLTTPISTPRPLYQDNLHRHSFLLSGIVFFSLARMFWLAIAFYLICMNHTVTLYVDLCQEGFSLKKKKPS